MLKSLELFGFKSFADRTVFEFSSGITGVVGPNGSGKSNVVDGIKWILGDQSAKSLRGKEMTDVIFNGATGRKAAGFSEATLTFDNSNNLLPLPTPEVHIGRRLYRNGDSEYLINRTPARLKDVRELFMGTGAGASAYCIIEQGRVDQILQANATTRRQVFEEAAGISRFKSRKNEALRKLERVDQNLLRLKDIVDEVDSRLNSLRTQAAKAAKFRETSQRLRELWLGLAADDYRHWSAALESIEAAAAQHARDADELTLRQNALEERIEAIDAEVSDIDDRLRGIERNASGIREQNATHQTAVQHQSARQHELDAELERLRTQRVVMHNRLHELSAEMQRNHGMLERVEEEHAARRAALETAEHEYQQLVEQLTQFRSRAETLRQQLQQHRQAAAEADRHKTGLQSQLESQSRLRDGMSERSEELEIELAAAQQERDLALQHVAEAESKLAVIEESTREISQRRRTLDVERNHFHQSLTELREQRMAAQARRTILQDLESRQEGLGIGVKEILNRAETSHYPPWNRILGSVADLIDVDLEHAALLELALGTRTQLIVLQELGPLIDYLNSETCHISGRVGFVALENPLSPGETPAGEHSESEETQPPFAHFRLDLRSLPDLRNHAGVVQRADELIRVPGDLRGLPTQLLADTWIVESLDAALALSAAAGRGCRFVTLQGELLGPDGTLFVGTVHSETAIVSRKSELRRLKDHITDLDRKIAHEQQRLQDLGQTLTDVDGQLESVQTEVQELLDHVAELKRTAADKQRQAERVAAERQQTRQELDRLTQKCGDLKQEIEATSTAAHRAAEATLSLETRIADNDQTLAALESQMQSLTDNRASEQLEMAKSEERVSALRESQRRFDQELELRIQQRDEAERRFHAGVEKRRQIVLSILNTTATIAELYLEAEQFSHQAANLLREKAQLRGRRSEIQKEENTLRRERNSLSDRQHEEEIKARDLRHQITALEQRIAEEYQEQLFDVVASGASAYQAHLDDLRSHRPNLHATGSAEVDSDRPAAEVALTAEAETPIDEDESAAKSNADTAADAVVHTFSVEEPAFEDVRGEFEEEVNRLRRRLKNMGSVDIDSLNDLNELESRYEQLKAQLDDLVEAKTALEEIVRKINAESKRLFSETFDAVRSHFQELFRKLFGGGEGDVILEDVDDILECGIDIVARPPGKELRSISLLSGGEKTMTAVALLLAIFKSRPSPFCILDECDAALDDANVDRYVGILKEFRASTQFILITHRKPTMTVCDVLYGVTMEQSGVSKRMAVRFEDVNENGEFTASGDENADQSAAA